MELARLRFGTLFSHVEGNARYDLEELRTVSVEFGHRMHRKLSAPAESKLRDALLKSSSQHKAGNPLAH